MAFLPGSESAERIGLFLSLTNIRSEDVRGALSDHLVTGHPVDVSAALNNVRENNLRRALVTLEAVEKTVESIKEIDWSRFKSVK